jgi:hypothetical protein
MSANNNSNKNNRTNDKLTQSSSDAANNGIDASEYWDRLPEESGKAWHAYQIYLYLGPTRSFRKVMTELDANYTYSKQLEKWSRQYSWVDRACAWDRHIDEERKREYIGAIKEMAQRQAQIGRKLQDKAREGLQKLDVSALKPADLVRLLDVGVKIERSSWEIKEKLSPLDPIWYSNAFNSKEEEEGDDDQYAFPCEITPEIEKKIMELEESIDRHTPLDTKFARGERPIPQDEETMSIALELFQLVTAQGRKERGEEID